MRRQKKGNVNEFVSKVMKKNGVWKIAFSKKKLRLWEILFTKKSRLIIEIFATYNIDVSSYIKKYDIDPDNVFIFVRPLVYVTEN
jgi:hypothetical protein